MRLAVLFAVFVIVALSLSCDEWQLQRKQPPAPAKPPTPIHAIHRFALTRYDGGVAFDTQTGQICRTWDWSPVAAPPKPGINGLYPQRTFGEYSPTCISLYKDYPSGMDASVEVTPDQPTN
jgi:hypothetical protein